MRYPLFVLIAILAAAPSFGGPESGVSGLKKKIRIRPDWANRFQDSRQGPETTERFSRTVRIGATGSFELSNIGGDVTVTGGSGDSVRIEAIKRVRSREGATAKTLLDELRIEVTELPNRVEVRTVYPRERRNYSGSVDYTIAIPSGASASIRTVSGDVQVSNVKGELRAESVSGNVVTTGANRLSLVKSVSGDVEVNDATADAAVSVTTVSGDVRVRGLKARAIDLGTVSGDVIATNLDSDRATVKSVSGAIEYHGTLSRTGRYEMNSHSGDVRLTIANTTGFELEATTFSGEVRSDFPLKLRAGTENPEGRSRRRNQWMRGSYGDAGAIVNLKSFSGDIVLTKP